MLYAYPERITDEFIAALVCNTKVVPYLDLPIQHCDDAVLKAMNRRGGRKEIEDAIHRLRKAIPGITLRTTLIAGFPGETEEQYAELCDFVKTMKFDRLGCFAYSAEENTVAAKMDGQLDEETKQRRADHIMELQAEVSAEREGEKGRPNAGMCLRRCGRRDRHVSAALQGRLPGDRRQRADPPLIPRWRPARSIT